MVKYYDMRDTLKNNATAIDQYHIYLSYITMNIVFSIPGLLATVFAISKVADGTGVSWIELL